LLSREKERKNDDDKERKKRTNRKKVEKQVFCFFYFYYFLVLQRIAFHCDFKKKCFGGQQKAGGREGGRERNLFLSLFTPPRLSPALRPKLKTPYRPQPAASTARRGTAPPPGPSYSPAAAFSSQMLLLLRGTRWKRGETAAPRARRASAGQSSRYRHSRRRLRLQSTFSPRPPPRARFPRRAVS